jgi:UDP-N-acetylglucosamine 1-carboxyvinyltransferase
MAKFIIRGGKRLSGKHRVPGNKNAALPMLAAALLTDEPVCLRNVPLIDDVRTMLGLLEELGADVELRGHTVRLCAKGLRKRKLDESRCRAARSSILFAGPMIARHGRVTLFPPGGDVIGRRRLDTHFDGFRQLGVSVSAGRHYTLEAKRLRGARILLDEASVTATENLIMAAVLARGTTTLFNAACEPHVQDLCRMLNKMGARISRVGTNYLKIEGVRTLHGVTHRVSPDYIDAASFLAAAAVTGGSISLQDVPTEQFDVVRRRFQKFGVKWDVENRVLTLRDAQKLRIQNDLGDAIPKIEDGPWPNFPSDLMSVAIVLATQARGTVLFFEKMFESRMYFVDRLIAMGARIVLCDPHRVLVTGPSRLHCLHMASPDIRAGMALLIAALAADGESVIDNAECIDRGYENVARELARLGADISRVE